MSEHERVEVLVGPQDDTWFVWEARGTVDAPQCRTRSEVRGPSRRRTGIPDGWSEVQVGGDCWGPQIALADGSKGAGEGRAGDARLKGAGGALVDTLALTNQRGKNQQLTNSNFRAVALA